MPANDTCVLLWGDGRVGNIIFRDFTPVAALDWEMATVGPPEIDVAWTTFFQRLWLSTAKRYGLASIPSMFEPQSVIAAYERLSGRALHDFAWFEAFSGLRLGIILMRMTYRAIAFGQPRPDDPDHLMNFPALLAELLDALC